MKGDNMDERNNAPEIWWQFRFKDGHIETATNWTPKKVQRETAKHGAIIGIAQA